MKPWVEWFLSVCLVLLVAAVVVALVVGFVRWYRPGAVDARLHEGGAEGQDAQVEEPDSASLEFDLGTPQDSTIWKRRQRRYRSKQGEHQYFAMLSNGATLLLTIDPRRQQLSIEELDDQEQAKDTAARVMREGKQRDMRFADDGPMVLSIDKPPTEKQQSNMFLEWQPLLGIDDTRHKHKHKFLALCESPGTGLLIAMSVGEKPRVLIAIPASPQKVPFPTGRFSSMVVSSLHGVCVGTLESSLVANRSMRLRHVSTPLREPTTTTTTILKPHVMEWTVNPVARAFASKHRWGHWKGEEEEERDQQGKEKENEEGTHDQWRVSSESRILGHGAVLATISHKDMGQDWMMLLPASNTASGSLIASSCFRGMMSMATACRPCELKILDQGQGLEDHEPDKPRMRVKLIIEDGGDVGVLSVDLVFDPTSGSWWSSPMDAKRIVVQFSGPWCLLAMIHHDNAHMCVGAALRAR